MTAESLWQLPDDGNRYELIGQELRTLSLTGWQHGGLAAIFTAYLTMHVLHEKLGRVLTGEPGFVLATDPDTVLAPDVAFVRAERLGSAERNFYRGVPDLAVEITSPSDRYTEVEEKVATWLEYGTKMVIVVNPRRQSLTVYRSTVDVRHLSSDDRLDGEEVVSGWSLPIRDLFA